MLVTFVRNSHYHKDVCTLPVSRAGEKNQVVNTSLEQPLTNDWQELVYKYRRPISFPQEVLQGDFYTASQTSPAELSPSSPQQ